MATIKICDICGAKDNITTESFVVDRRMDAAGSMDDIVEIYDLCQEHLIRCLRYKIKFLLEKSDVSKYAMNSITVEHIRLKIKTDK